MNPTSTAKIILLWISMILLGVLLLPLVPAKSHNGREDDPSYSEFMAKLDVGDIMSVTMYLYPNSYELHGEYARPPLRRFHVTIFKEAATDLMKQLRDRNVQIRVEDGRSSDWGLILPNAALLIVLVGFCLFQMRQMQYGGNKKT
jgi:ATP-dependent Zn protease